MTERQDGSFVRGAAPTRCPFCHAPCAAEDDNVVCNGCLARHHRACWDEGAGCATCPVARPARTASAQDIPALPPPDLAMLSPEVRGWVEAEVPAGERLLWVGQPLRAPAGAVDVLRVIVGLPFLAVACAVLVGGVRGGALDPLIGLAFGLVGAAFVTSPWSTRRRAARTCYVVTDRRVVVWTPQPQGIVQMSSVWPGEVLAFTRTDHQSEGSDLIMERNALLSIRLERIPRAREVEALVRAVLARPTSPSALPAKPLTDP
ncbi:MAG: hypothetical protein KF878_07330 [Planctomycetes bacterium]|nr:hypothetical protein [Planctomycetota bacterium]